MPTAEARLTTDRASRYLVQLCRHLDQMTRLKHLPSGSHREGRKPPAVQHVDYTDTRGTVRFADGQWTLEATVDALRLRVDADDEEALQRLRDGMTARIEKIGRRDALEVNWLRQLDAPPPIQPLTDVAGPAPAGRHAHRPRGTTLGLLAGGAILVAVHLGIGGAALAGATWTGWAANAVLVLVLVKLLFLGGHLLAGRAALRRGITPQHLRRQSGPADTDVMG